MNGLELHHEAPRKRQRQEEKGVGLNPGGATAAFHQRCSGANGGRKLLTLSALDDDVASAVVPPVTVVFEGRSICHRICLDKHASYESLAKALRLMFVDVDEGDGGGHAGESGDQGLDLSNAVPGYMVAYEDTEDDLLLVGDLNWKDFVRVARRIRIIPAKPSRQKHSGKQMMK